MRSWFPAKSRLYFCLLNLSLQILNLPFSHHFNPLKIHVYFGCLPPMWHSKFTLETHLTAQTKQPLACSTALEIHFWSQSWQFIWIFNTLEEKKKVPKLPNLPAVRLQVCPICCESLQQLFGNCFCHIHSFHFPARMLSHANMLAWISSKRWLIFTFSFTLSHGSHKVHGSKPFDWIRLLDL